MKASKPQLDKVNVFAPLLFLNATLVGEMDAHLNDVKRLNDDRRYGKMQKQVQISMGEVTVSTPRYQNSTFDPQFIKE